MSNTNIMETLSNARPDAVNFLNTLLSCGYDMNSIDFFMHFLSWKTKVKSNETLTAKDLSIRYFESANIFFLLYTQFSTYEDNYFAEWLRMIMSSIPNFNTFDEATARANVEKNIIPYINKQALERTQTNSVATDYVDDDDTSTEAKKWIQVRNLFKKHFSSYMRHVASWPLNTDKNIFIEYQSWLGASLLIRPGSQLYMDFIHIYKQMESNLASLTNYKMNGEGLCPMPMNFHYKNDTAHDESMKDEDLDNWKITLMDKRESYEISLHDYEYSIRKYKEIEKKIKKEEKKGNEDRDTLENKYNFKDLAERIQELKTEYEAKREELDKFFYNPPWIEWPQNVSVTPDSNGIIDRWYAWASQFWLYSLHSNWFRSVGKMSKGNDTSNIFRATQIVMVDDSSAGSSRFCRFGLSVINMPQLVYVYTLRNDSPWWRPPEVSWEDIRTDAEIDVENIKNETDRLNVMHRRLQNIKESLTEGFLLNGNVVLYTTSNDLIGYCLLNNVPIIIFNNWLDQNAVDIISLREQVIRQTGLLGQMVTQMVPESTLILTYIVLMALSCSSGMALYVTFGWENVFKQWFGLVKEYQLLVKPNRLKPEETCAWLARYGSEKRIILNKNLLTPLILRLLQTKFAPDKAPIKLGSAYNVWSSRYSDLIEENRVSSGRVQPVAVPKLWNPNIEFLYLSRKHLDEDDKKRNKEEEESLQQELDTKRLEERQKRWRTNFNDYKIAKKEEWDEDYKNKKSELQAVEPEKLRSWNEQINIIKDEIHDKEAETDEYNKHIENGKKQIEKFKSEREKLISSITDLETKVEEYQKAINSGTLNYLMAGSDPKPQLDNDRQELHNIEDSITTQDDENDRNERRIKSLKIEINLLNKKLKHLLDNKPFHKDVELSNWAAQHPRPDDDLLLREYEASNGPYPTGVEPFDFDAFKIDLNDSPLDLFDMDSIMEMEKKEIKDKEDDEEMEKMKNEINANIELAKWKDKVEWMYAQRQIFQSKYYAPKNIEDLLLKFRIRFKDWTGAETITINN